MKKKKVLNNKQHPIKMGKIVGLMDVREKRHSKML